MKKIFIFLAISILFFAVGHSAWAQGGSDCTEWDFTTGDQGWSVGTFGTYSPGVGWLSSVPDSWLDVSGSFTSTHYYYLRATFSSVTPVSMTRFNLDNEVTVFGTRNVGDNSFEYTFTGYTDQITGLTINVQTYSDQQATLTGFELCASAPPTPTPTDTPTPTPTSFFFTDTPTPTPTFVPAPGGTPSPSEIGAMTLATLEMPYNFTPVDISTPPSGGGMPSDPAASIGLGDLITDVSFLNRIGSIVATIWTILDGFAGGGVLAIFVIILLAVVIIRWIASFVYNKPISEPLNVSAAGDVVGDVSPSAGRRIKSLTRQFKNRPRF